jgi:hypothetical protein
VWHHTLSDGPQPFFNYTNALPEYKAGAGELKEMKFDIDKIV